MSHQQNGIEQNASLSGQSKLPEAQEPLGYEDFVLVVVISLGFLVPLILFIFKAQVPAILPSILISSAVSALVYRFLGGIDTDGSLMLGAVRIGGSMAALVGLSIFLNPVIDRQVDKIAAQSRPFEAIVMELGQRQQIGGETIELIDLGSLPQRKIYRLFEDIRRDIKVQYEDWGQRPPPDSVIKSVLVDFCNDIIDAMRFDDSASEKLATFPQRFLDRDKSIDEDWEKIVNALLEERCKGCVKNADRLKLRQALDLFPFAMYRTGPIESPNFRIVTPMTEGITLGDQHFDVPVFANPQKKQLRSLLDKNETNLREAIVIQRSHL